MNGFCDFDIFLVCKRETQSENKLLFWLWMFYDDSFRACGMSWRTRLSLFGVPNFI